ncbi:MAG: hypothetical protein LBH95_03655 [Oscillospiraceae bacterium]|jgi:hypothetical protein|nr:hypothetical protein [Oscillospiraceae bacterium]
MAGISPIGPSYGVNIAPLNPGTAVKPVNKPNTTYAPEAPNAPAQPETGRNLAPAGPGEIAGIVGVKDGAAKLGMAAEQSQIESIVPRQMVSLGKDGKVEDGNTSAAENLETIQKATAEPEPGETPSMFDTKSAEEAFKNENDYSFEIKTPDGEETARSAIGLVNGYNAMSGAAGDLGSDRLQSRLDAIYETSADNLSKAGIGKGGDGSLRVESPPGPGSESALRSFAELLKTLAEEVSQNPASFAPKNGQEGVLYQADGGALAQISSALSSIGQLFDSYM